MLTDVIYQKGFQKEHPSARHIKTYFYVENRIFFSSCTLLMSRSDVFNRLQKKDTLIFSPTSPLTPTIKRSRKYFFIRKGNNYRYFDF